MSIIDEKYRDKYREPDWIGGLVDKEAKSTVMKTVNVKDEEGNVTGTEEVPTKKTKLDLDKFFALCTRNKIDTAEMEAQRDRPNAAGRIRMTLGNRLRAAAKRRCGLYTIDGEWVEAPAELTGGVDPIETPEGEKIAKQKPEEAKAEA